MRDLTKTELKVIRDVVGIGDMPENQRRFAARLSAMFYAYQEEMGLEDGEAVQALETAAKAHRLFFEREEQIKAFGGAR